MRKKWEEWGELWNGEIEKFREKLGSIENRRRENNENRKREMKVIEDRARIRSKD